ncbi:uncharacterized protein A1O5_09179 [Cladophialophora psammophila CBS 110553]|uniref:Uncharacterized protein n=1 Tax=Cladophialophora psammophila CBS 110553 TaxID=1182543 RepID=W9WIV5_9EURO|nr:uncharacterized protein A1O5_09179 [Cladophialophora psammophila CBS 110553]EXJ67833.1 hypothetical protein A1O5_09179 [Cladophialophora psammophila CBS 110553]
MTFGESEPIARDHKMGNRYISFPLTLAMNTRSFAKEILPWDTRQPLRCRVKVKWSMKVSFSTTRDNSGAKFDTDRVILK